MEALSQWIADNMVLAVLVLTRVSTLLLALPAVGTGVPMRVRALLAITMTALLLPSVASTTDPESLPNIGNLIELSIAIAREGVIGLMIGATVQLLISGIQLAGEGIVGTSGMQLGDAVDPATQGSLPVPSKMIGLLVTSIMLIIGGHRMLLTALIDSFKALPAGRIVFHESMFDLILTQLSAGMAAGIRVAAPVIAALLLSNFVTGLISRTMPQINLFAIGLSLNAIALLMVTAMTIGSVGLIFQEELSLAASRLTELW